jgi:hypothetical protein
MARATHGGDLYPALLVCTHLYLFNSPVAKHAASCRCPLCQDYLTSIMRDADHAALLRSGVRLVVIGCGSYGLIRSYRRACPNYLQYPTSA